MRKIEEEEEWLKLIAKPKKKRVKKAKAMNQVEAARIVAQATNASANTVKAWWRKNKVAASLTLAEAVLRSVWLGQAVRVGRLTIRVWVTKEDSIADIEEKLMD